MELTSPICAGGWWGWAGGSRRPLTTDNEADEEPILHACMQCWQQSSSIDPWGEL